MSIHLFTDSAANLSGEYLKEHRIGLVRMIYHMNEQEYLSSPFMEDGNVLRDHDFYDAMRAGAQPTTSQSNEEAYLSAFEPALAAGEDVLYVCFSSGLSGQINNALLAKAALEEKYPGRRVLIVDSLSASLGQGLLVQMAVKAVDEGKSGEEIQAMLEKERFHIHHRFMVEDLVYLKRGGRISAATAVVGTLLSVKPILYIDDEGHLIPNEKAQGHKRAMKTLVNHMVEKCGGDYSCPICLVHADASQDDIDALRAMTREQIGRDVDDVVTLCPIIGAHTGPGLLALIFLSPSAR